MIDAVERLVRPKSIAVIGASSSRETFGNVVIRNLAKAKYTGRVWCVHPTSAEVDGAQAVRSIQELPADLELAFVSVAAPAVADVIRQLEAREVPAAIANAAGFAGKHEEELRALARETPVIMHGPNCMGLINVSDGIPLYTAEVTPRLRKGPVAAITHSGSATVSVINTSDVGFSKVITIGSEYRVTVADYMQWLAQDPETSVIALELESVIDADKFADAIDAVRKAGKSLVVLKVGRSMIGSQAAQAHTGGLLQSHDAFRAFAEQHGVPVVDDYDDLVVSLEVMATRKRRFMGNRLAIAGSSGGETALLADLCADLNIPLAKFSDATTETIRNLLPNVPGTNPLDYGASVGRQPTAPLEAMTAIMADDGVAATVFPQDMHASLTSRSVRTYSRNLGYHAELTRRTEKPIFVFSSTSEPAHEELLAHLKDTEVLTHQGYRTGLIALRSAMIWDTRKSSSRRLSDRKLTPEILELRGQIAKHRVGPLPLCQVQRLLERYKIPLVRSAVVATVGEGLAEAPKIGFPMVVKLVSRDVPHRSDIGAVKLGIQNEAQLRKAIEEIAANVRAKLPEARIEGYELQEELVDCLQAVVGYQASPPYGAMTVVGSGGVLVELEADTAVSLSPISEVEAAGMLAGTKLGKVMAGYRNLMPRVDERPLSALVARLSELARDLWDLVPECDLNPVMIRKGTGDVRVVDALFVRGGTPLKGEG